MTDRLKNKIQDRLEKARGKHPDFTKDHITAFSLLLEEVGEVAKAYNDKDIEAFKEEIIDTIVVLIRMYYEVKE